MVLYTGAGYKLIHKRILTGGYEEYLAQDGDIPALCDANGKRLATLGVVMLKVRLGNAMFTTRFMVVERLAGDVLIGTEFLNHYVESIRPRSQKVELRGGGAIPILSTRHGCVVNKPFRRAGEEDDSRESGGSTPGPPVAAKSRRRHGDSTPVIVSKMVAIPPMSQKVVTITCDAGELHLVEPQSSVQERQRIRVTNGVVDLKPRERFPLVVTNYSRVPGMLARGMVIAGATANPMGIYTLDEDASLAFENVLNLPLEREVPPEKSPSPEENTPAKEEEADADFFY